MEVVILAGGRGKRLQPLTDATPKPLLSVRGKPLLEWSLLSLRPLVSRVIVVVSYRQEQISAFMQAQQIIPDWQVIEQLPRPLGTGHALQCCASALAEREFVVLNGDDLYSTQALTALMAVELGILTVQRSDPSRWGVVVADAQGRLMRLHEKPPEGLYPPPVQVNTGAYKFTSALFDCPLQLSSRGEYEITDYVTCLARDHVVQAIPAAFWTTVGTLEDYEAVQSLDLERLLFV